MANILDLLNIIGNAIYGKDVRKAIIDAIRQCYEDGKAGVNDLHARTLIEAVMTVNEQQAADIDTLTARVEELETGESGESAGTTTTKVPTFLVESGVANFDVGANKTATKGITFTKSFTEAPTVIAVKVFRQGANTYYSQVTAQPIQNTITATGFTLAVGNKYSQAVAPSVLWVAFQPIEVEVNTEIIVPSGDGMTEAEVRALLAPITAALDNLKIGYDGTEYDTPGASLREQINALHVLIGDEPGTAIPASVVAYNDSNVAAELTNVNGRLTTQETAIGDLSELETEDKTSIVGAVNELKQSGGRDMSTLIGAELLEAENAFKEVEWVNGYFDATGTIKYSTTWKHVETFFPVRLIKYIRSFSLSINSCAGFVFYADDKETVISTVTKGTYDTATLTIVPDIPDGAEWFRCSQYITETKSRLFTVYALEDFIKEEVSRKIGLPVDWSTAMVTSGGIAVDGTDGGYDAWHTSDYIEVFPGMNLIYTGAGNVGGNKTLCPLAFYDENKVALKVFRPKDAPYWSKFGTDWTESADSGTIISSGYITVPAKAKYVRVCGYKNVPPFLDIYRKNSWMGKKCAFFGDSITAGIGVANANAKYSEALRLAVGIASANYAVNGSILVTNGWDRLSACLTDHANDLPDAFIFAYGTNDWGNSKPMGDWYTTDASGTRTLTDDTTTFRGALVRILTLLRTTYADKKVILMTPIHRGPGSYASDLTRNNQGLYLEDYCEAIREAGKIFGVPVIDLYHDSGLVPDINPDTPYFSGTDRLHPNGAGHALITTAIAKALERIPI